MHGRLWSPSYFAMSRGGAQPSIIRQHIEQQGRRLSSSCRATPP